MAKVIMILSLQKKNFTLWLGPKLNVVYYFQKYMSVNIGRVFKLWK